MDKKTTEMTITELEKAIPSMGDDDLRAAFAAEKAAGADKERKGAISALEAAAKSRSLDLAAAPVSDGALALATPGAQPATDATEEEREDHAETIRKLTARVDELEAAKGEKAKGEAPTREEVLSLHRRLEALANHLNFRLPA